MSLVGPRPIISEEIALNREPYNDYVSVNLGITGVWQISGRSGTTFDERVALDAHYVESQSMAMDAWIILLMFRVLLSTRGAR